jgi:hypothetical protein
VALGLRINPITPTAQPLLGEGTDRSDIGCRVNGQEIDSNTREKSLVRKELVSDVNE